MMQGKAFSPYTTLAWRFDRATYNRDLETVRVIEEAARYAKKAAKTWRQHCEIVTALTMGAAS